MRSDRRWGPGTIRLWPFSKVAGIRDGKVSMPGDKWTEGTWAPSQHVLSEFGVAEDSRIARSWDEESAPLEGDMHSTAHRLERAALDTEEAEDQNKVAEAELESFRTANKDHSLHRGWSWKLRAAIVALLFGGDIYMTYTGLLSVGDSHVRWLAAAGLGCALVVLGDAVGSGLKGIATDDPEAPRVWKLIAYVAAALALMVTLALARQTSFNVFLAETTSQIASASGGSADGVGNALAPSVSWLTYLGLQLGIYAASVFASERHFNWRADVHEILMKRYASTRVHLDSCRDRQQAAADAKTLSELTWGAAFAAKREQADESAAKNRVLQHRYWDWNRRTRGKHISPQLMGPIPVEPRRWWSRASIVEWLGRDQFPTATAIWPKTRSVPGNGHHPERDSEISWPFPDQSASRGDGS